MLCIIPGSAIGQCTESAGAEAMLRSADEVLAISIEQGFALWLAFGNVMRGWSLAMLGRSGRGDRASSQGARRMRRNWLRCRDAVLARCGCGDLWLRRSVGTGAPTARTSRRYDGEDKRELARSRSASAAWNAVARDAGHHGRRKELSSCARSGAAAKCQVLGTSRCSRPCAPLARRGPQARSPCSCLRPFMVGSPRGSIYPT